jgi:hypothetical protein
MCKWLNSHLLTLTRDKASDGFREFWSGLFKNHNRKSVTPLAISLRSLFGPLERMGMGALIAAYTREHPGALTCMPHAGVHFSSVS